MFSNTQLFMFCVLGVLAVFSAIGTTWYRQFKKDHPELKDKF